MKQFFSDEETMQQEQNKTVSDNNGSVKEDESVGFATEEQAAHNVKVFDEIAVKMDELAIDDGNAKYNAAIFIGSSAVYAGNGKMKVFSRNSIDGCKVSMAEAVATAMKENENFAEAIMAAAAMYATSL